MNNDINMTCSDIQERLKQLQDDRLIEEEYHAFFLHLESCVKCKEYVRAVGSLSNQLWKLGDVNVPSDLSSNILFKVRQSEQDAPQKILGLSKKLAFGTMILIIGFFTIFGVITFFKTPKPSIKADGMGIVKPQKIKEKEPISSNEGIGAVRIMKEQELVSDEEAENLFNQLQEIATSVGANKNSKADEKISEEVILKKENDPPLKKSLESDKASIPDTASLHWHIPYSKEAEMTQLVDTIKILEIDPDYEEKDFLVFKATGEKLKILSDGIGFTGKLLLDLPDFIMDGSSTGRETPVSIYFMKQESFVSGVPALSSADMNNSLVSLEQEESTGEYYLDWHVLLLPSQREKLLDVIRQGGGKINYTSKGAVIFTVLGARIRQLSDQIRSTGGVFIDFGHVQLDEDVLIREMVNVLIAISEK